LSSLCIDITKVLFYPETAKIITMRCVMKWNLVLLFSLSYFVIACSSGPTAPATIISLPTAIPQPTDTPKPASTPKPTPALAIDVKEFRKKLIDAVVADVSGYEGVQNVTVARLNNGVLEIELKTRWASQDSQPDVSFTVIRALAVSFAPLDRDTLEYVAGGPFQIHLTTYSADGNYPYHSVSDWETLNNLATKGISHEEWVTAAGAAFK
jgi:hypothetical protein